MRRGRLLILFALLLLFGALAVFFVLQAITGGPGPGAEPTPPIPFEATIVIAAQDIPRGALIAPEAVILSPFPQDMVVETMLTDLNLAVGRRARMDIARGVPLTQNMVTRDSGDLLGTGSDAAIAIPPGMTAIAVPMTRLSGVAFAMRPGDQVDVLVSMLMVDIDPSFQTLLPNETLILLGTDLSLQSAVICEQIEQSPEGIRCTVEAAPPLGRLDIDPSSEQPLFVQPTEAQRPRLVTQRLVEGATVLRVGTFPITDLAPAAQAAAPAPETAVGSPQQQAGAQVAQAGVVAPDIITLIVSPQDALALNWAVKAGLDMVMTLRAPNDPIETDTISVTLQYLVENYNITVPSKLPYGLEPRLDRPIVPALPNEPSAQATPTQ